jgi:nucleotide-binding universal stress UspA family protein
MKTIIVPIDFSDASINAAEYALEMAIQLKAKIKLLHVYQIPIYYGDVPILASDDDKITHLKAKLQEVKKQLLHNLDSNLEIAIQLSIGDFMPQLNELCSNTTPYCVVIGCQGKSGFDNIFLGSNAIDAMKNLRYPIIAVPIDATFSSIKNIGLACDFEIEMDKKIVNTIENFATDFGAQLFICNIGKEYEYNVDTIYGLHKLGNQLNNTKITKYFLENDNVEDGLTIFEKECKLDIITMFPKTYHFFEKIIHISATKKLVLSSSIPILALHQ